MPLPRWIFKSVQATDAVLSNVLTQVLVLHAIGTYQKKDGARMSRDDKASCQKCLKHFSDLLAAICSHFSHSIANSES